MDDQITTMIQMARHEVGYHEGRTAGRWNNVEKYAAQVPGLAWVNDQRQPWCAVFVSWLAAGAGVARCYPRTASTDAAAAWFKDRREWHDYPAVGAQVFYGHGGDMVHTGLVVDYDDDAITTVEGNTNDDGSAEGDGVYLKHRRRRDAFVQGYGYPDVPGGLKAADPAYRRPDGAHPTNDHVDAGITSRGKHVDAAIADLQAASGNGQGPDPGRDRAIAAALRNLSRIEARKVDA